MYSEFYGFDGNPFQLTPDERFFFHSNVHDRAMNYLRYGLRHGEGFVVITGQPGTGKTMLVRYLFKELENTSVAVAHLASTNVGADDMLRMICASLGLAHDGMNKATLLHNLEVICRMRYSEGRRTLLILDEAQNLSAASLEELRLLGNYQIEGQALFQSFLLGQNRLKKTLQDARMTQFRQRIIASYHLEPLSGDEIREYIAYRLGIVGWKDDPLLEDAVFDGIFEVSWGLPRVVNLLCDRLLLYGCVEEKHELGQDDLRVVVQDMEKNVGYNLSTATGAEMAAAPEEGMRPEDVPINVANASITAGTQVHERITALEERVDRLDKDVRRSGRLLHTAVAPLLGWKIDEELD